MRFLIDELFSDQVAALLRAAGHDAIGVRETGLEATGDELIYNRAVRDDRVIVTENIIDFVKLANERSEASGDCVPVVLVLKKGLPNGAPAMSHILTERLMQWCEKNPDPYRHVQWLSGRG